MVKPTVMPFYLFCEQVLHLELTNGQRVVAKVAFGNYDPQDLEGDERELALQLFGGLLTVPAKAKRFVCMRLGRGSGKTTLCSAYAVYVAVCQAFQVGPGDTPYVITIAPDLPTAKLSISMCREMIRGNPAIERLVCGDEKTVITLRRPNGQQVKIEAFAASRGGSTVRGRTILAFLLDEAEFFTSNGADGASYAVSDTDIFRALKPRLVRQGKGMLVSTPWPVETLMGGMFDANWGKCQTAVAIKAPTLLVRGDDPDIRANVEDERERDPDNCRREYDCELDGIAGDGFFDATALVSSVLESEGILTKDGQTTSLLGPYNRLWPTCAAADLGFKNDSSTLAIVQFDGRLYHLVGLVEMRPKPGAPLKPSAVVAKFASVAKTYGCTYIISDGHYRESVKEHLEENGLALVDAPEGMLGKQETFSRVRSVLHEGLVALPKSELTSRLVAQAKLVTAKAAPGGGLSIKIPRKVGLGHGDLVSAWVLAVHNLAYGRVKTEKVVYVVNTPEYNQEVTRRLNAYYASQNAKALAAAEKEVKRGMKGRRNRDGVIFGRA
jgi:hypothetical protein